MNQVEFAEFATALLQDHTVEVFHEEGLDDSYSLAEAAIEPILFLTSKCLPF